MPSSLALLLCVGFVWYILKLERHESTQVSGAVWIPILWILAIASKPLGDWFLSEASDIESGSPLDRYFLSLLLCVGIWVLSRRGFDWGRALRENFWVAILIAFMFVSILWSNVPFMSFKRWIRELTAIVMAFVVVSEVSPRQALECVLRRSFYILVPFSILLIKFYAYYGRAYDGTTGEVMWIGVTTHKNSLGRLCIVAAMFLAWAVYRKWSHRKDSPGDKWLMYADAVVFLMVCLLLRGPGGAYSATASVVFFLGLAVYFFILKLRRWRITLGGAWTALLCAIVMIGILLPVLGRDKAIAGGAANLLGRDATLTGRTDIWGWFVPIALKRPILGTGFGGFWTTEMVELHQEASVHNGYLNTWLQLGVVGLFFTGMFYLSSCSRAQRLLTQDFDWAALWMCYLIMSAVHNWTETSISSFTAHMTAVLLFLYVVIPRGEGKRPLEVSQKEA
jgi:exopolysaccharide production protein ExoQ